MSVKTVFSTIFFTLLTGATPVLPRGPTHHGDGEFSRIFERLSALTAFQTATYYYPDGAIGACGARSSSSDLVVALNPDAFNGGHNCWRRVGINYNGKYVEATTVDLCPGCGDLALDLSPATFKHLAPLAKGRIQVNWHFL
ncbi:RlpA-like double-psi beta-barrel-protein domain-containing protein-containing protein [Trametes elegans]|nr:RlpA-like double-psi beta-barrel-protein domain-containing protein-containing protein [Trametes elegans]